MKSGCMHAKWIEITRGEQALLTVKMAIATSQRGRIDVEYSFSFIFSFFFFLGNLFCLWGWNLLGWRRNGETQALE